MALHHPHLDANAEVVSLSGAHVNGVALLVVGHVNDMFARLQFECEVAPVVHPRQLDIVNENRRLERLAHHLAWTVDVDNSVLCVGRCRFFRGYSHQRGSINAKMFFFRYVNSDRRACRNFCFIALLK